MRVTWWLWLASMVGVCACSGTTESRPDSGTSDGGSDAAHLDASDSDAGIADAGSDDASTDDAGVLGNGRIEGVVTESLTQRPLAGATVEAGGRSTSTSSTGEFALTDLPTGVPLQLRIRGPQGEVHSTTQRSVVVPEASTVFVVSELLPGCAATVDLASADGVIAPRGCGPFDARVGITLPQEGVVDSFGTVVHDVRVELAVLPVSVGGGVASDALSAFPGDMQAVTSMGASTYLESLGAVEVRLTDVATGAPLQLAAGKSAVVTFSASETSFDESSVPAWYFDEAQGRWVEEGTTSLVSDPVTGALLHRLEVQHFTFWNADKVAERACVTGRLVDGGGAPLAGTTVLTHGLDYIGQSNVLSGSDGRFEVFARRSSEIELVGSARESSQVTERRLRVRTNPDASCVDVGDVLVDTARLFGCVSGRVVDVGGQPLSGVDVFAEGHARFTRTVSGSDGTFCLRTVANERFEVLLSGAVNGIPVVGRRSNLQPAAPGAACGGSGCTALGDVVAEFLTCIAGRVLDGAGPVSGAQVLATGSRSSFTRSDVDGDYCLPVEQNARIDLSAFAPVSASMGQLVVSGTLSGAASCGGTSCQAVDLVLADAACVRGVVVEDGVGPMAGVKVNVTPVGGGRVRTVFSGVGGAFCAPVPAGSSADLEFSMARPGTRYFASARVAAPAGPASCGGSGCSDAGQVTLTGMNFSGCVKGRFSDSSEPFRIPVDVFDGNRVALVRPREDGSFCADVPVAVALSFVDPEPRVACVGLRSTTVDVSAMTAGSCADETTCLDVGDLDFSAFCASS